MKHRRILIIIILLFLGATPLAIGGSQARGGARGITAWAADERPQARGGGRRRQRKGVPDRRAMRFSEDLDGLRAQFNRDKGQVRLLMLLSPT